MKGILWYSSDADTVLIDGPYSCTGLFQGNFPTSILRRWYLCLSI
jgi:hypothetical protein